MTSFVRSASQGKDRLTALVSVTALLAALMFPFVARAERGAVRADAGSSAVAVAAEHVEHDASEVVSKDHESAAAGHTDYALVFGAIALLLIAAKAGALVERIGQPAVLGEIVMGLILGNLALLGWGVFRELAENQLLIFLAEIGVVILLFQIGLESDLKKLKTVGGPAFFVAIIGVIVPMVLGWKVVGPWLFPGQLEVAYLFLGAALTATSVGITARVFQDLGKLQTPEAQTVLGAAVIDDVLGLLILAVVSGIATAGSVSPGALMWIIGKAFGFLVGAIVFGQIICRPLGGMFSRIHTGVGMKLGFALSFAFALAAAAQAVGLAPIVGAFAAGLILDPVVFSRFRAAPYLIELRDAAVRARDPEARAGLSRLVEKYTHRHVEDLVEPIGHFLVPIFFVLTGMRVDLVVLSDPAILGVAVGVSIIAILGKLVAGLGAQRGMSKLLIGFGMVPRGEVGLIFANVGKSLGVVSDELFAVVVVMVIVTTLITPPTLAWLLKRQDSMPDDAVKLGASIA
jgi:Kef-type K+ transport system membrane component KefB